MAVPLLDTTEAEIWRLDFFPTAAYQAVNRHGRNRARESRALCCCAWEALHAQKHQQNELHAVVAATFPRAPCALPLDSPIRKPRYFVDAVFQTLWSM